MGNCNSSPTIEEDIYHDVKLQQQPQPHPFSATDRYQYLNEISRGTYGVVRRAWDKITGETVAIKEEFYGMSVSTRREIRVLQSLPKHPSIVEFKDAFVDDHDRVFVVMEYIDNDLWTLMTTSKPKPFTMTGSKLKCAMRQILEGVAFLHDHGIMHRDIKPSNILVSNENDVVVMKLCDFGLSRFCRSESGAYSPYVVTQWYKAPELLVAVDVYSFAIDMWSVGCIMAEFVLGHVLFQGSSELHQWDRIHRIMAGNGRLLWTMAQAATSPLTALGFDLLRKLLECDPSRRITAREALNHAWFDEF